MSGARSYRGSFDPTLLSIASSPPFQPVDRYVLRAEGRVRLVISPVVRRGRSARRGQGRLGTAEEHHAFLRELRWRREDTVEMRERCRSLERRNALLERELERADRRLVTQQAELRQYQQRVRELELALAQQEEAEDPDEDPEEDPEEDP